MITPNPQLLNNKYFILHDLPHGRILTGQIIGPIAHEWATHYLVWQHPPTGADDATGWMTIPNQAIVSIEQLMMAFLYDDEAIYLEEVRTMHIRLEQIRKDQERKAKAARARQRKLAAGNPAPKGIPVLNMRELMTYLEGGGAAAETDDGEDEDGEK